MPVWATHYEKFPVSPLLRRTMKKQVLKKMLLGLALAGVPVLGVAVPALVTPQPAYAQPDNASSYGAQAGRIADQTVAAITNLNLSASQLEQLRGIAVKYVPEVRSALGNKSLDTQAKRARLRTIRVEAAADADSILNATQKSRLRTLRNTLEGQVMGLLGRIGRDLQLTKAQQTSLRSIAGEAHVRVIALVADSSLSRTQRRQQLFGLASETRNSVAAVLTPAQRTKAENIFSEIRSELEKRASAWRVNGGLLLGLLR